jgi:hypothetical protein
MEGADWLVYQGELTIILLRYFVLLTPAFSYLTAMT